MTDIKESLEIIEQLTMELECKKERFEHALREIENVKSRLESATDEFCNAADEMYKKVRDKIDRFRNTGVYIDIPSGWRELMDFSERISRVDDDRLKLFADIFDVVKRDRNHD